MNLRDPTGYAVLGITFVLRHLKLKEVSIL